VRRLWIVATVFALVGLVVPAMSSQAATLNVPKTAWPECSAQVLTYCVESVSIQTSGQAPEQLTWVPSVSSSSGSTTSTTSTTTTTSPSKTSEDTTQLSGYWTDSQWSADGHAALGFDGVYVSASAANEFSNDLFFDVQPALQDPTTGDVYEALQTGTNYPASLSPNDTYTVVLETGQAETGVSMIIGENTSVTPGTDANGTTLTFSASPVPVALASGTGACSGEQGVAVADADQLQAFVAVTNDPISGFGVPGISGDMFVESNGACTLSTPVWNSSSSSLSWTVGAPHFLADGVTINRGFYEASIPDSDAALLWGLTNPDLAASALDVSVTYSGPVSEQAVSSVSVKNGEILISSTNFSYSKPTFTVKRNPKYHGKALSPKRKIVCVKGKSIRRVSAYVPRCPSGFSRRR
jgi:hypothetical protein